jgi:hypothetical protein
MRRNLEEFRLNLRSHQALNPASNRLSYGTERQSHKAIFSRHSQVEEGILEADKMGLSSVSASSVLVQGLIDFIRWRCKTKMAEKNRAKKREVITGNGVAGGGAGGRGAKRK